MEFYGILWDNLFYCQVGNEKLVALGGASFSSERSPSVSEGGLSEEVKNREGVASGSAT